MSEVGILPSSTRTGQDAAGTLHVDQQISFLLPLLPCGGLSLLCHIRKHCRVIWGYLSADLQHLSF